MNDSSEISVSAREQGRNAIAFVTDGHRWALAIVGMLSFVGGLLEALFLVGVTRVAFSVSEDSPSVELAGGVQFSVLWALFTLLCIIVGRILFAVVATWFGARLRSQVVAEVRHELSESYLNAAWEVQQQQRTGSFQELLTRLSSESAELARAVTEFTVALMNLLAMLVLALWVDPIGAIVLVVTVGVLANAIRPLRRLVWRRSHEANVSSMGLANVLSETSELGLELHVHHVQAQAGQRIDDLIASVERAVLRRNFASGIIPYVYSGFAFVALLGALALVNVTGTVDVASMGAVVLVMLRSLSYGQGIQRSLTAISSSSPAVIRVNEALRFFRAARRRDGDLPLESARSVAFDGVSFSYVPGQPILTDLSFSIAPCEAVGIIGPSGGGKSTLVQLILGLRTPDRGTITIDGHEIGDIARADLARRITLVPQSANLIAGTISDNIRFFRPGVSDADVERAAKLAHLHDEIVRFPDQYDREVGDRGGELSGGQQQRLCIARALVEDPDILILDEPTSALDMRSEHLIRSTLVSLKERMTILIVAHRLSTLEICDRIMVVDQGRILEFDSRSNVEMRSEFYREALRLSGMR